MVAAVAARLDLGADDAGLLRDEAGDDAVVGPAGVEEADVVVAEQEGAVLGEDCYCGVWRE